MTLIVTQFDVPGDGKYRNPDHRKRVALDKILLRHKIDALRIVPAQQIVNIKAPGRVHKLIRFQVSFNIQGEVDPEIVGYPELIPCIVIDVGYIVYIVERGGIGHRATRHIDHVGADGKSAVDTVVGHYIQNMGPVEIGGIGIAVID